MKPDKNNSEKLQKTSNKFKKVQKVSKSFKKITKSKYANLLKERKSIKFYRSYYELSFNLTKEEAGEFFMAILNMQFNGVTQPHSLSKAAKFAFSSQLHSLKSQLYGYLDKVGEPTEPTAPPTQGGIQGGTQHPTQEGTQGGTQHPTQGGIKNITPTPTQGGIPPPTAPPTVQGGREKEKGTIVYKKEELGDNTVGILDNSIQLKIEKIKSSLTHSLDVFNLIEIEDCYRILTTYATVKAESIAAAFDIFINFQIKEKGRTVWHSSESLANHFLEWLPKHINHKRKIRTQATIAAAKQPEPKTELEIRAQNDLTEFYKKMKKEQKERLEAETQERLKNNPIYQQFVNFKPKNTTTNDTI